MQSAFCTQGYVCPPISQKVIAAASVFRAGQQQQQVAELNLRAVMFKNL
jgi:hypothetical protein